jgi:hypothetical protein
MFCSAARILDKLGIFLTSYALIRVSKPRGPGYLNVDRGLRVLLQQAALLLLELRVFSFIHAP